MKHAVTKYRLRLIPEDEYEAKFLADLPSSLVDGDWLVLIRKNTAKHVLCYFEATPKTK